MRQIKENIIRIAYQAGEGHIASAFSILDLLLVLYGEGFVTSKKEHRFVLSKGHASLALYAVLAQHNFFANEEIFSFCKYESNFGGHPDRTKLSGVEASTGSLGHGFPIAVGMALAEKIQQTNHKIFVVIGDGELNEGSVWESMLLAAHHQLDNLCCIVDFNHSTDRALSIGDLQAKFTAFGWHAFSINGHDHEAIKNAYSQTALGQPLVIIAETIKGYGCKVMENNPEWHHKSPSSEELELLVKDLY